MFAGAVAKLILRERGVAVAAAVSNVAGIPDPTPEQMEQAVLAAKADGDSVGGCIRCTVTGLPAGLGDKFEALPFSIFYTAAQYQDTNELLRGFGAALVLLLLSSFLLLCARRMEVRFRRRWQGVS